ncbi:ArdC-like ssDNA-binding domain-containing protein [Alicyclobacillus sendaiensis]|uniref:ArdC-like ssDNA-binding domain-containing protein n=1 Tax=Alicyclobacillus sendaiensis TaxID=192387 RepID=UPI0026F43555|nr:ArdC-like ssDNA-binding domain-containing protein [Alicyclobacillus sendaiensis]
MNEKVKTAMERLEQGLETLLSTEEWRKFLQFQAAFHHYSFSNTLLIMCQKPDATYVAGYNRWKELGRYVKKGEHGIEIFAPLLKKKSNKADIPREESDETPQEKENKRILYGYRIVYVFDVSQTDGKPLPTVESPKIISGDSDLYEKLLQVCPYPVSEVVSLGSARGEFDLGTNQIRIVQTLPEAHKAKTLIHEWAHGLLHTNGPLNPAHKPLIELEAESTAFVVSHALGLDTTDYSFAYIAGWRGKEAVDALKACGTRIQQAANSILMALEDQAQDFKTAM